MISRLLRPVRVVCVFALVAASALAGFAAFEMPSEEHSVVNVLGQEANGEFVLSELRCYPSEAEADADAAGGMLSMMLANPSAMVDGPVVLSSTFTLGKHFDGFNGTGSSISVVGTSCSGGWWNTSTSWDNRISSSWNGCYRLRHHDGANKTGSYEDTYGVGTTDNLSWLNNAAESVSYWAT